MPAAAHEFRRSQGLRRASAVLAASLALLMSGCASDPSDPALIPVASPIGAGRSVTVLAATTRARAPSSDLAFTADRAEAVNYQQYVVSIPPVHASGKIEWPSATPGNPASDFVVASSGPLDEAQFAGALGRELAADPARGGSVVVFVHGYNTKLQEAVFRTAELGADLRPDTGAMVAFSWPSRAKLLDYATDRESVTYSRDSLEKVLDEIAGVRQVRTISIVAHSMGTFLAVETLRQAKFRAHSPFLNKLGDVLLLSPDIDLDVFRSQIEAIGRLPRPIIAAVSDDDRALAASQFLAGGVSRVGNALVDDPGQKAAIEQHGLKVVDLSQVNGDDAMAHSKFLDAIPQLQNIATSGESGGGAGFRPGVFVLNGVGQVLAAPARVGGALLSR